MKRLKDERGAIAVLFALTVVILFAAVAFVIDISRLYHERQVLQNAVDFGALAGAQDLPVQGSSQATIASGVARTVATANAPQIASIGVNISYKCVVGDRDGDGAPDASDIPFVCGPVSGNWSSGWITRNGRSTHVCDPFAGDKCNTIRLSTASTIPYFFAPVIGITSGSTGAVSAASCKGLCGAASSPIDVVMVLDRTGSMTDSDVANVKNAALSVLDFYEPATQWIGMVSLPYGQPSNKCEVYGDRRPSPPNPSPVKTYQLYPDSNATDGRTRGSARTTSGPTDRSTPRASSYSRSPASSGPGNQGTQGDRVYAKSDGQPANGQNTHTNLGDPLDAAREMLATQGRADVPDVIIFMTDGQANQPSTRQPCTYFNNKATIAKNEGQTIFTIAYGLDVNPPRCAFGDVGFSNAYATTNLATAATQPTTTMSPAAAVRTRTRTATTTSAPRGRPTWSPFSARWRPRRSRRRT